MTGKYFSRDIPPRYLQHDAMDCAPACLKMIAAYYGKHISFQELRVLMHISRSGVSLFHLIHASKTLGFDSLSIKTNIGNLQRDVLLPCILHWTDNHYVVLYRIRKNTYYVIDPAIGYVKYSKEDFTALWQRSGDEGIVMLLEPGNDFRESAAARPTGYTFDSLRRYFMQYKGLFYQLFLGLLVSTGVQVAFPYITQSIVDKGIVHKNIHFIVLVAIGQSILIASRVGMDFLRSWVLLHISTRINISLLSDFLIKLIRLPVAFFDAKNIGDIFQRIGDHKRVEQFITLTTLNAIFSLISLLIFSSILLTYSKAIFFVFLLCSILYFLWTFRFLKKRKEIDYKRFAYTSRNQNILIQMIEGMAEIKLNNADARKKYDWENLQARLFKLNMQALFVNQNQQSGAFFINEIKNIITVCLSAYSVIKGDITLGAMMAIQYIIGQLNSPISQFVSIVQIVQDAKISMDRINEIHTFKEEADPEKSYITEFEPADITLTSVGFAYPGITRSVLSEIDLVIPRSKMTAIVGTSGSGKTTLIKLLMKFYYPASGDINVGSIPLPDIAAPDWRAQCGAVLQDGYIFSDTIAQNIAPGDFEPDYERIGYAIKIANLEQFIKDLPAGLETRIGAEGNGLSQGQRQRLLIARSVYKDPEYLFFDEATNALDANNERIIMRNLQDFFQNRTVVVVAHRLSTVKHADKIVVLEEGRIAEEGNHFELIGRKGKYFELIKNQLELSN